MGSTRRLGILGALGALLLAACGSSSHSTSASSASAAAGSQPKGSPIKVFAIVTPGNAYQSTPGLQLGIKELNAQGGINGHRVVLSTCNDQNSPAQAGTCARQEIAAGGVAEIYRSSSFGSAINPIEQAAGIPIIGGGPFSEADFDASNAFYTDTGTLSAVGSAVLAVKTLGAKRIGVPYVGIPSGATLAPTIEPLIKPLGATTVGVIPIPETAADITSQVAAEIQAKPDAVIDGLFPATYVKFILQARQQGSGIPFLIASSEYGPAELGTALGKASKNIYVDALYNLSGAGFQQFVAAQKKYMPSFTSTNTTGVGGWMSDQLFAYAAAHASSPTPSGLMSEMRSITNWSLGGLTPPLDFAKPPAAFGGKITRLSNNTLLLYKFDNGAFVPVGHGGFVAAIP